MHESSFPVLLTRIHKPLFISMGVALVLVGIHHFCREHLGFGGQRGLARACDSPPQASALELELDELRQHLGESQQESPPFRSFADVAKERGRERDVYQFYPPTNYPGDNFPQSGPLSGSMLIGGRVLHTHICNLYIYVLYMLCMLSSGVGGCPQEEAKELPEARGKG